jgi:hypothetical protein
MEDLPVSVDDIAELPRRLKRFAAEFEECFVSRPTHAHFLTYMRGQASRLERKSVEPMALEMGVPQR